MSKWLWLIIILCGGLLGCAFVDGLNNTSDPADSTTANPAKAITAPVTLIQKAPSNTAAAKMTSPLLH